jgi:hypothetical protein
MLGSNHLEHMLRPVIAHDEDDAFEPALGMSSEVFGHGADHRAGTLGQVQPADAGAAL